MHVPNYPGSRFHIQFNPDDSTSHFGVTHWDCHGWLGCSQSGRPIFDDFFQHLWPYIGNNTANVVFQMVKRLWLIRIDQ
ncbi:hypothetical protein TNCV_4254821 [Trichonephila clavipes]|nr:hypothetical protein TNCV_4254821 [Trichonephila clavipes]